jgi:SAM-dependent methyltransferase
MPRQMHRFADTLRDVAAAAWWILGAPKSIHSAIASVRSEPSVASWMQALRALQGVLDPRSKALLANHRLLHRDSAVWRLRHELDGELSSWLASLDPRVENIEAVAAQVISRIVSRKTVIQCRDAHRAGGYYAEAEPHMESQWIHLIAPHLGHFDLSRTLELAPGHGRNSAMLAPLARELHLVDVNQTCIDACRARFGERWQGCRFHYYVNDGSSLPVPAEVATFIYSFDSVVHFDKSVVSEYFKEFRRVLVPGGGGLIHHSNYGEFAPHSDWATNPGGRSDVSAALVAEYCKTLGLEIIEQHMHGKQQGRHMDRLDCLTLFRKS